MDRADENNSQTNPQQAGEPAESLAGEDRSGDWTSRRYCRKVLAEEIERPGGNEINAVVDPMSGSSTRVVKLKLPRNPPSIKAVGSRQQHQKSYRQKRQG